MQISSIAKTLAGPLLVVIVLAAGWSTRETWKSWLIPVKDAPPEGESGGSESPDRVKLTEQAQRNLRLVVKEVEPTTYWRKIYVPGTVVDRPGRSDRGISAPLAGVVTHVFAVPGKVVHAGDELFRLRLVSDTFQASQMELYKSTRELAIVRKERTRLEGVSIAIPTAKLLELDYQMDRLQAVIHAHRQDLLTRQLTEEQIDGIIKGEKFVKEITIRMPERFGKDVPKSPSESPSVEKANVEYDVQELKVNLGDHVQPGQIMAYLSDHRKLYIEGKALKNEAQLIARAAEARWSIDAEFNEADEDTPAEQLKNLTVEFISGTMDPNGMTLSVYIPFDNPHRDVGLDVKGHRAGQFRPGQKALLKVPVDKLQNVFVVPIAAVVREGAETYVFRQNGSVFNRRSVHVIAEDSEVAVIANDGSIARGTYLAQNAAAALNRVLKANQGGGDPHGHSHSH